MGFDPDLVIIFPSFLIGIGMVLWYRLHRAKIEAGQGADELRTAMHELQVEMDELRGEQTAAQAELHERIDFAERLLAARAPEAATEKTATPADHAVPSPPC